MNYPVFTRRIAVSLLLIALCSTLSHASTQKVMNEKIKIALIYTVTTPELKEDVEREIRDLLGQEIELLSYEVPEVFEEVKETGYVTARPAARLIRTYMQAVEDGAEAILSICSTVGDIVYSMQDASKYLGIPILMINEEMCREAVRQGNRIAVMATFPTAIAPTINILERVSREMGKPVEISEVLLEGAFGIDQDEFRAVMAAKAGEVADRVDVIVFAQGSMAYCEKYIAEMYGKVVLSNPRFGAEALKEALTDKGLIGR